MKTPLNEFAGFSPADLLKALVEIPSPSGREAHAVAFMQSVGRADGLKVIDDDAGNFIVEAGEGRPIWFVGHIDTVPGMPPVSVEDGVLWGRGSVDAKGPLVAAYCALRRFAAVLASGDATEPNWAAGASERTAGRQSEGTAGKKSAGSTLDGSGVQAADCEERSSTVGAPRPGMSAGPRATQAMERPSRSAGSRAGVQGSDDPGGRAIHGRTSKGGRDGFPTGKTNPARVIVVGCVDEEGQSRGVKAWLGKDFSPDDIPRAIIVGEPSGLSGITLGYKGLIRGRMRVTLAQTHGGHPEPTAAEVLWRAWQRAQRWFGMRPGFASLSGKITAMDAGPRDVMDHAEASFEIRLPPGAQPEAVEQAFRKVVGALEGEEPGGSRVEVHEAIPPALAPRRGQLAATLASSIRAEGARPRWLHKTGTADFNLLRARFPDVPIVAYGPGDSNLDHAPDERVDLSDVAAAERILARVFAL